MMKPKEALVKDGFSENGKTWGPEMLKQRGRLSKAATERIQELLAKGWDIEGYQVSKSSDSSTAPVVTKVKTDPNAVVDIREPTRFEDDWTAWAGDASVGMRTVCNNCRCSLTYCPCPSPLVWMTHETQAVVHFKPKA